MNEKLFLELLYNYGIVEFKRSSFSSAIESFSSFISYTKENQLNVDQETVNKVKKYMKVCEEKISTKAKPAAKHVPSSYSAPGSKKKPSRGKTYQKLKTVSKEKQKQDIEKLWKEMKSKTLIDEGSKWYVISTEWFDQWKKWSGFEYATNSISEDSKEPPNNSDIITKDSEVEEPGRIDSYDILDTSQVMLFGEYMLKDNLNEDQDYVIVNPDIWRYLYSIYDGTQILRTAIKNIDKAEDSETAECVIEVNLIKLFIFEVPRENKQDFYEVMLVSRNWDLADVKEKIWTKKKIKESDIRLWKMEKPQDLNKFYVELEYEWKKYKTLRIDGILLKDYSVLMKDADFSRDDFWMLEFQIPTTNENGYALVEVEKKGIKDALNEEAFEALMSDEEFKTKLADPKDLQFLSIPIKAVTNDKSVTGVCGLSNLGNTCFMNCALQCMSNTIELTKYFWFRIHESEINHTNVLGSKGRVAEAYGELINDMWIGSKSKAAPFNVKKSIGTVVAQFRGYNQQDAHEFLHYLIDTLNEDLSRIKQKPYVEIPDSDGRDDSIVSIEQWDAFTARNDSVLVDMFYGQLKSHLVCLTWDNVSNTFDPFSILSIPVPVVKIVKLKITYYPNMIKPTSGVVNLEININDNYWVTEVEKLIQNEFKTDSEMIFYMYDSSKIGRRIRKPSHMCRELVGMNIGAFGYKIDKEKSTSSLYILDVYMKRQAKKMLFFSGEDTVCLPFVQIVDAKNTCREICLQIFRFIYPILQFPASINAKLQAIDTEEEKIEVAYKLVFEDSNYGEEELYELQLINNRDSMEGCPACRKPHKGNCKFEFKQKTYKSFLAHWSNDPEVMILWKMSTQTDLSVFEKPEKMIIGEAQKKLKNKKIDLDMCMNSFRQEEILDGENKWYWNKCKEHVKARKKMDLYRLPPILIIHLKRFLKNDHEYSFFRNASRKITELVDFPIKSLDMSEYLINEEEKKNDWIYDLYGVSNHMGKLHGGHYTATWYNSDLQRWLYFDDSSISKMTEKDVIDPAAYVLFYRRRNS